MPYTTTLPLANLARAAMGETKIADWAGTGNSAVQTYDHFKPVMYTLLKRPDVEWLWARRFAELSEDTSQTHYTEWDNAYDAPADMLQVYDVLDESGHPVPWELHDSHIMTNYDAYTDANGNSYPRIRYLADPFTSDADPTFETWVSVPDEFAEAFALRLAYILARPLTKNTERIANLRSEYQFVALPEAEAINAVASPGYGPPEGDWTEIEYS